MEHRTKLKSGDEFDALTGWRRVLSWRTGQRKKAKRSYRKRLRREHINHIKQRIS